MAARLILTLVALLGLPAIAAAQAAATLGQAIEILRALPAGQKGLALAAEASPEGHWTFANPAGERFTTASAEEHKRVLPTLAPEAAKPGTRLTLVLTEDTGFRQRAYLQALPLAADRRTDLMIVVGGEAYALLRRGERAAERFYAEIRPSLLLELNERRLFDEAAWQLSHPMKRAAIRVLALEPDGPQSIPSAPRLDPQTKRAMTDQIAPASLANGLRSLAGQTVMLTARRDGDLLAFRPASGPEQTVPAKDVLAAAEAADVNLVVLQSATPRQPGTRSWLWQRVSVGRLDDALARDHLADFLNALAPAQSRLLVSVEDLGAGRIRLAARPLKDDSSPRTGIGEAWGDLVSSVAGQVVVSSVEASLRDRARQGELDRRLVPGIPSLLQWIYGGLLALGFLGHVVGRGWWAGLWPPEQRESYGGVIGYFAARAVRAALYAAVFMPLVGIASAPLALLRALGLGRPGASPSGTAVTT